MNPTPGNREKQQTIGSQSQSAQTPVKTIRKRVASLKPSPENLRLYKAIEPTDPETIKLAESIKRNGCDALVITSDGWIVSGHRRHAALLLNGQAFVSCRVLNKRRSDFTPHQYITLLREHNHQRHKTVAEQMREELIDINPSLAHQNLQKLRDKSVYAYEENCIPTLTIQGKKTRHSISKDKADHVKYIKKVVFEDRRKYWPLSVRAVHYALLNYKFHRNTSMELDYVNDADSYQKTSELITRLRLLKVLPWESFDDPTRPLTLYQPWQNVRDFARHEIDDLFDRYWRDLLQSQPNHIELLCEKNTIYGMALTVTKRFQIHTSSGRGFNSIDPYYDLFRRYEESGKKSLILITLTDFDPEGQMIPQVAGRTLRDDFGVDDLQIIPAGVTRTQIKEYNLPPQNVAKESSSNHKWFVEQNGGDDTAYELEALEPEDMLRDLETVITSTLDMDLFNREAEIEQEEAAWLEAARTTAGEALEGLLE